MDARPRFEIRPEGQTKKVLGDGDCSVHALVCAIMAWILSLGPGQRKAELYAFLMSHCYNRETKMIVPSQLRMYIGTLGDRSDPGVQNVLDIKEPLVEEGSAFFFNTASYLLRARINVWIHNEYHPFGDLVHDFDLHIINVPGHFETLVPYVQLIQIMHQLGANFAEWRSAFFVGTEKYLRAGPPRWDKAVGGLVHDLYQDLDEFQGDLCNSLKIAWRQPNNSGSVNVSVQAPHNTKVQVAWTNSRDSFGQTCPKRTLLSQVTVNVEEKKPEWHEYWFTHLKKRLTDPTISEREVERLWKHIAQYESLTPTDKEKLDKRFFEEVSAIAAARIAKTL